MDITGWPFALHIHVHRLLLCECVCLCVHLFQRVITVIASPKHRGGKKHMDAVTPHLQHAQALKICHGRWKFAQSQRTATQTRTCRAAEGQTFQTGFKRSASTSKNQSKVTTSSLSFKPLNIEVFLEKPPMALIKWTTQLCYLTYIEFDRQK